MYTFGMEEEYFLFDAKTRHAVRQANKKFLAVAQKRLGDRVMTEMLQSQPVIHEIERINVPTLLLIGERDRTALGRERAKPADAEKLGNYPVLAREAAAKIPGASLVTFPDLGHAPHIEAPERFNAALIEGLEKLAGKDQAGR